MERLTPFERSKENRDEVSVVFFYMTTQVNSYTRRDGTVVRDYVRRSKNEKHDEYILSQEELDAQLKKLDEEIEKERDEEIEKQFKKNPIEPEKD